MVDRDGDRRGFCRISPQNSTMGLKRSRIKIFCLDHGISGGEALRTAEEVLAHVDNREDIHFQRGKEMVEGGRRGIIWQQGI